jgi:hypothetical protein
VTGNAARLVRAHMLGLWKAPGEGDLAARMQLVLGERLRGTRRDASNRARAGAVSRSGILLRQPVSVGRAGQPSTPGGWLGPCAAEPRAGLAFGGAMPPGLRGRPGGRLGGGAWSPAHGGARRRPARPRSGCPGALRKRDLTDGPGAGLGARQQLGPPVCGVAAIFRQATLDQQVGNALDTCRVMPIRRPTSATMRGSPRTPPRTCPQAAVIPPSPASSGRSP